MFENDLLEETKIPSAEIPLESCEVSGDDLGIEYMDRLVTCLKESTDVSDMPELD